MLSVRDLHVSVEGKEILRGVSLDVRPGEVVALMGPNGSGKSTLAYALMGHPRFQVAGGTVTWKIPSPKIQIPNSKPGEPINVLALRPEERAKLGLFLSFQYPHEIPGVPLAQMLRVAAGERTGTLPPVRDFVRVLDEKLALLKIDSSFAERPVNEGFSGGEKKRAEILQLAVLEPALAILDETDSGLDVDALRTVAEGIAQLRRRRPRMSVLLITHYERFLEFLTPDRVLVMKEGRIVAEGGSELAAQIQRSGYETFPGAV